MNIFTFLGEKILNIMDRIIRDGFETVPFDDVDVDKTPAAGEADETIDLSHDVNDVVGHDDDDDDNVDEIDENDDEDVDDEFDVRVWFLVLLIAFLFVHFSTLA